MQGIAPKRRLHVLVVESEAVIALHLKEQLTSAGHSVIGPFLDPQQALAAVTDWDAVISPSWMSRVKNRQDLPCQRS